MIESTSSLGQQTDPRFLQVSTLGNDGVSEGDSASYIIPYVIAVLTVLGVVIMGLQYLWWWFCKYILGREDPIDVDYVMANLTDKQRELVLQHIVTGGVDEKKEVLKDTEVKEDESLSEQDTQPPLQGADSTPTTVTDCDVDTPSAELASTQADWDAEVGGESEGPVCPICIGVLERTSEAVYQSNQCTHRFHSDCILEWLVHSSKSNNDCPICRAEVVSQEERIEATLKLMKEYPGWEELGAVSSEDEKK